MFSKKTLLEVKHLEDLILVKAEFEHSILINDLSGVLDPFATRLKFCLIRCLLLTLNAGWSFNNMVIAFNVNLRNCLFVATILPRTSSL